VGVADSDADGRLEMASAALAASVAVAAAREAASTVITAGGGGAPAAWSALSLCGRLSQHDTAEQTPFRVRSTALIHLLPSTSILWLLHSKHITVTLSTNESETRLNVKGHFI